ncbi:MAG TPA: response regulator [Thiotrichales bacterium]|nr:response regulator [Thiotrichales bacterium]
MSFFYQQQPPQTIDARVHARLVDRSYQRLLGAILSTLAVVTVMFFFLQHSSPWSLLAPWAALFVLLLAYRTLTLVLYRRFRKRDRERLNYSLADKVYFSGLVATGCLWGAMVIWLLPALDVKGQILFFVIVMGMASGAIPTMACRPVAAITFIILLVVPLLVMVYEMAIPNVMAVLVALVVYALFALRTVLMLYTSIKKMLILHEKGIDHERELARQKDLAEQASQAKTEFLSRMSHELRTPLNAVVGLNELLQMDEDEPLSEKQRLRAEKIRSAAGHLLNLVNDVLDISRVENGDLVFKLEAVECAPLVQEVLTLLESKMHDRRLTARFEEPGQAVWLRADPIRLRQVILNLLENAVKFNRQGGSVTIVLREAGESRWRLSVIDTGYGLTDDDLKKLFVPFARLSTQNPAISDSGVSLSYTRQLVEKMGGELGIESRPGQGSCFWFELPAASPEQRKAESPVKEAVMPAQSNNQPSQGNRMDQNKTVLLVEDNLVNQEVVVDMLEQLGVAITITNNGKEAVEACRQQRFDLVLMDCEMPVLDGLKATRKIREEEKRQQQPPMPVVALTAHAISGAREQCFASGMNDFLSKPFSFNDIRSVVEKWTGLDTMAATQTPSQSEPQEKAAARGEKSTASVIDKKVIDRLRSAGKAGKEAASGKKTSLLVRAGELYLQQTPELLGRLSVAVEAGNVSDVIDIVHSLKSSSSAIGAMTLAEDCRELELSAREEGLEMSEIKHLVTEIHHKYQQVEGELKRILDGES